MTLTIHRRHFLSGLAAATTAVSLPGWSRTAFAQADTDRRLVVVILRGALDGLTALAPVGDPDYAGIRGLLALETSGPRAALKIDPMFALHPSLANFQKFYQAGELRPLHAVAIPVRQRSHFEAQAILESGLGQPGNVGWLNRALKVLGQREAGKSVAFQPSMPLILSGDVPATTYTPPLFAPGSTDFLDRLAGMYAGDSVLAAALKGGRAVEGEGVTAMHGAKNDPNSLKAPPQQAAFVATAKEVGAFIARPDGPNIAVMEAFGWDTHISEGAGDGQLAHSLSGLDAAMAALREAATPVWGKTVVVIVTEFGRTARPNGARGTDHGTASAAFLLGGAVKGGAITADWPGLADAKLFENRDLAPTLDMRSLFKGVLAGHLGLDKNRLNNDVFPDSNDAPVLNGILKA